MNCFKQHTESRNPCPDCGYNEHSADQAPHLLRPRTILNGKYLVGRVLGQGGFGITYVGWDLNLGLRVALKEYYPSGFVTRETTSSSGASVQPFTGTEGEFFAKGREKFINEARSLAKFFTLPGIVSVKDYFLENGTAYITMEFIDGQTLKEYVANMGGKLIAAQVFDLMKPVMSSLAEVHKAGIIHRDISPDNIMISKDGYLKLLDFGAARDFTQAGAKSMSVMLKPGFAPEEQYRTKGEQGPWTDVYALSATMYRCITGVTPEESVERVRKDNVLPPSALGISIDQRQETAMMMGMAVLQDKRFQSIPAIYSAMYGMPLSSAPASAPTPPPQNVAIPPQNVAIPSPQGYAPPPPPQVAIPSPQVAIPPQPGYAPPPPPVAAPPPQVAIPSQPGYAPPQNVAVPQQKSGSWISNNKAMAGVLGGILLLVLALGIVLLIMFLPGGSGNSNVSNTPTPTPTTPVNTPTPTPTPTPNLAASLYNTTWDLYELDTAGIIFDSNDLISLDSVFNMWFDGNGDFVADFHAGGLLFGTWRLSGSLIYVDIDGEIDILTLTDNKITLTIEGMIATFIRNDHISFNPPDKYAVPNYVSNYNRDEHFLKGTWWFSDGPWIYHFGTSEKIIFLGNGDVYSSEDEKWATWYAIEEYYILIVDERGVERYFVVYETYNMLEIMDEDGDTIYYDRIGNDSPVGSWVLVDMSPWIFYFGASQRIEFFVDGTVYESTHGRTGLWGLYSLDSMIVWDSGSPDYTDFPLFYTSGDNLMLYDASWNWAIYQRAG